MEGQGAVGGCGVEEGLPGVEAGVDVEGEEDETGGYHCDGGDGEGMGWDGMGVLRGFLGRWIGLDWIVEEGGLIDG